jgi:hypothetical protein
VKETFERMARRVAREITHQSELSDGDVLTFTKFATRIREELCKGQEPVAWVTGQDCMQNGSIDAMAWPTGEFTTPLYLHPAVVTESNTPPADMVLVPREPTQEMAKLFHNTYMVKPFTDAYKSMIAAYEKEQGK